MLKFYLIPTLEHLALSSLSRELWKQPDILSELRQVFLGGSVFAFNEIKWDKISRKVLHKLTLLHLPHLLNDKAEIFIEQIGRQIILWIQNNKEFLPRVDMVNFLHLLQWNSLGGIDEKKTAALILKRKNDLSLKHRYILACNNCLEDSICLLWKQFPLQERKIMSKFFLDIETNLVTYWSSYNEGTLELLDNMLVRHHSCRTHTNSFNDFYLYWSLSYSNNVAFQYFWEKLSEEEKRPIYYAIKSATSMQNSRDIFYFLATRMNENQLKEMVERDPSTILYFWFREGVGQNRFLFKYDDIVWDLRPSRDFCRALTDAAVFTSDNVLSNCFGNKSQMLFRDLWKSTPSHIKRSLFKAKFFMWKLVSCLMRISDTETLQLIYDDASDEEKERIKNSLLHNFENEFFTKKQFWLNKTTTKNITSGNTWKEVNDFLNEILLSISSEKTNDERWPLLETLDKWKEKHVVELIIYYEPLD